MPDITMNALHSALGGLASRQRMYAKNIANIDTPGYVAGRVQFEEALGNAIRRADRAGNRTYTGPTRSSALDRLQGPNQRAGFTAAVGRVKGATTFSAQGTRMNGANVNLDDEVIGQEQTSLAYQTVLQAMDGKFRLLRTSITG